MLLKAAILASQLMLVHDFYDPSCCSGQDCKPVQCNELKTQDDGYTEYRGFLFSKEMRKTAPDGMCHVCISKYDEGRINIPRCVYFPAGS